MFESKTDRIGVSSSVTYSVFVKETEVQMVMG